MSHFEFFQLSWNTEELTMFRVLKKYQMSCPQEKKRKTMESLEAMIALLDTYFYGFPPDLP